MPKECSHKWVPLMGKDKGKLIKTSVFACLECGELKVGTHTIRISKNRLDMGNLPIKSIKTGTFNSEISNGNSGAAMTIDWTAGQKQRVTLTGDCTFTFTAPAGPCSVLLRCIGDGTARTLTWPATVKWAAAAAPTMTSTLSAWDLIAFYYDGTNYSATITQNYS